MDTFVSGDETRSSAELDKLGASDRRLFERVRSRLGLSATAGGKVGRFELGERLGAGGMGVVYRASDPTLDRPVAIKLVRPRPFGNLVKLRARLLREAQALAKLRHSNVIRVYDAGQHEGEIFVAMEYVAGRTLREWQTEAEPELRELLAAYIDAGRGLAAAHEQGVIHRDFKPDNVLISDAGQVAVGDFGLAGLQRDEQLEPAGAEADEAEPGPNAHRLTAQGDVLGTLGYIAPEQLRGGPVDARSDQYSFCAALWEAVCGARPYDGRSSEELLAAWDRGQLETGEGLPRWLRRLLERGLALDPDDRHPSMTSLVDELERGRGRGGRWLRGGAWTLALAVSLTAGYLLSNQPEPAPCSLETELEELRASPELDRLRERLEHDDDARSALDGTLRRLGRRAATVCARPDRAAEQDLGLRIDDLHALAGRAAARPSAQLGDDVHNLYRANFNATPPKRVSSGLVDSYRRSRALVYANDLEGAFEAAETMLTEAENSTDRAAALLQRAQIRALAGEPMLALDDYRAAGRFAESAADDRRRLHAKLLAAQTVILRVEDLEAGREILDDLEPLIEREALSRLDPQRAEVHELRAAVLIREGRGRSAWTHQLRPVLRHALMGDDYSLARSLANLGVIHELRGRLDDAERCYRHALTLVDGPNPVRVQVAYSLAHLLTQLELDAAGRREIDALLAEVGEGSELQLAAATIGLEMEIGTAELNRDRVKAKARLLHELLVADAPATARHRFEAWQWLSFAWILVDHSAADIEAAQARVAKLAQRASSAVDEELFFYELTLASFARDRPELRRRFARAAVERGQALPTDIDAELADARRFARESEAGPGSPR